MLLYGFAKINFNKKNESMSNVVIKEVKKSSDEIYSDVKELLSQLTSAELSFSKNDLERIITSPNSILFAAMDEKTDDKILGILTLVLIDIPTGMIARIEDVVVDKAARGKGIGETITIAAIQKAKELGITKTDLTSNPKREAANRLYKRLGFKERTTNIYRYEV